MLFRHSVLMVGLVALGLTTQAAGQVPGNADLPAHLQPTPNDRLESPVVENGQVTFSIYAPSATTVMLDGEMLPFGKRQPLERGADGVWKATLPSVAPGTYRYTFAVDGARVADPRNPSVSGSQTSVASLLHIDGVAVEDVRDVPHGSIAARWYRSPVFPTPRRMHVYTPPGYAMGDLKSLPVLYLFHGGGDSDESWSSAGRAGFILDNLIATGRAKPMIVVMPAGHVPGSDGLPAVNLPGMTGDPAKDPFVLDMVEAIIPTIEANYRVSKRREDRAIAGLSMGGVQSANLGLSRIDLFSQVAIFSSGWFPPMRAAFEQRYGGEIDRNGERLKLLWVRWGKDDPLVPDNAKAMVDLMRRHKLKPDVEVTQGTHNWETWRRYLAQLAPLLFQ